MIRSKYLLRHKCSFFFSYIFIPLLYSIFLVFVFNFDNYNYELYCKKLKKNLISFKLGPYILHEYNISFEDLTYDYLQNNSEIITLLVDNKEDCNSLQNFILKETNKYLTCTDNEANISNISIVFNFIFG